MGQRAVQLKTGWTLYLSEDPGSIRPSVAKDVDMRLVEIEPERRPTPTWDRPWMPRICALLPVLVTIDLIFQAKDLPMEKILGVQFLGGALLSLFI